MKNLSHTGDLIHLDALSLIDEILELGENKYLSVRWEEHQAVLSDDSGKSTSKLIFLIPWPKSSSELAIGTVAVSNSEWKTLPRIVLVIGFPDGSGDYFWQFFCPATLALTQVVFYDPDTQLFVSPAGIGRRERRSVVRQLFKILAMILKVEHKLGTLKEKPARMNKANYRELKALHKSLHATFYLSASGLHDDYFGLDFGSMKITGLPGRRDKGRSGRSSSIYVRDKLGALRLNKRLRQQRGIVWRPWSN